MGRIDTLTAYRCEFRYMERKNPLIDVYREAIQSGNQPEYSFSDFIKDYTENTSKMAIGIDSDRGIMLNSSNVKPSIIGDGVKRWYMVPLSGKQGKPVTLFTRSDSSMKKYGTDSAALYENHVFIYEGNDTLIGIFHRQNGSGCKSVFLETANDMLRQKGYKLEMSIFIPLNSALDSAIPTKLKLKFVRDKESTDIADNINGRKRKVEVIQSLGLNLESIENRRIAKIIDGVKIGTIDKSTAFAEIKREVSEERYNDADIQFRIGKRHRTARWDDISAVLGAHDITEQMNSSENRSRNPIDVLTSLSDEYYYSIVREMG